MARVVALARGDYEAIVADLREKSLAGGVVYDALIARAALKGKADRILTLNPRDFRRVWSGPAGVVVAP